MGYKVGLERLEDIFDAHSELPTPWPSQGFNINMSETDETSSPNVCRMMLKVVQQSNEKFRFRIYFCDRTFTRLGNV